MYPTFFVLSNFNKRGAIRIEPILPYDINGLPVGVANPPEAPLRAIISEGKRLYDLLGFQDVFNWAISKKFHDLLIDSGLTGWQSYEIDIDGIETQYFGFQCIGKSGPILRAGKKGFVKGLDFDISKWDKSDFFVPEGSLFVICTEKAKNILIKSKISNISIENTIDFELCYI
jgi:hypothetical protein